MTQLNFPLPRDATVEIEPSVSPDIRRAALAAGHDMHLVSIPANPVPEGALNGAYEMRRSDEAEGNRVADVQVAHVRSGGLDTVRFGDDVADRVREAA